MHIWTKSLQGTLRSLLTITWGASRSRCKNPCFRRRLRVDGCIKTWEKRWGNDEINRHEIVIGTKKTVVRAQWINQQEGVIKPRTLIKRRAFAQVVKRVILNPYLIGSFLKLQLRNTWKRWNKSSHNSRTKWYSPITWIASSKWWLRKNQKRGYMLCHHAAIRIFHSLKRIPSTCGEIRKVHGNTYSANTMAKHARVWRGHNHRTCKACKGPKHR